MSNLTYQQNGDYQIPNLTLETAPPLGKYGRMRRTFLEKHRTILFNSLISTGKLHTHLLETEEAARKRLEQIMPQLMEANSVTEALKAANPMLWTGMMNNLKAQAEEMILSELVNS